MVTGIVLLTRKYRWEFVNQHLEDCHKNEIIEDFWAEVLVLRIEIGNGWEDCQDLFADKVEWNHNRFRIQWFIWVGLRIAASSRSWKQKNEI